MGFAMSWLAVSGKSSEQVLQELELHRTGEVEEFSESVITAVQLPAWFLIVFNDFNPPMLTSTRLMQLANECKVVSCQVEEHVMYSKVACYEMGLDKWQIIHDAQEGIYHLETIGEMPNQFDEIFSVQRQEQDNAGGEDADVDYFFDIPPMLAETITNFRHDQVPDLGVDAPFEVLV
ncbi:hypothetical protein RF679_13240 [Undibacterium cyanobacteriorum]|uniref:Uncharacterized protein n=1 Tax=Undibacterium cyanobacteriorum TaxID=3073561 RepID=A0ABY9REG0_9BURK|nr:hypothetical protein [Undibacterium sp. 20NA77.5]WMW79610.1 hypothetical protein RF679_13240 [Undibacterium sp. 20NA77.5]